MAMLNNQMVNIILLLTPLNTNWWYTYPPEKYDFVRLDHHPNYWGK